MMQKELLVVGAGVTGSLTAFLLSRSVPGLSVTVWEKARGAGGRMATHRHPSHPLLHVDMGAQYISRFQTPGEDPEYVELRESVYTELLSNQTLVPFKGRIEGERQTPNPILCNYVAPHGLSSIAKYFIAKSQAKTCYQRQLSSVTVDDVSGRVCCTAENGTQTFVDRLVLSIPVPQILNLQGEVISSVDAELKAELKNVRYSSRYALGLFYSDGGSLPQYPWSVRYVDNDIIRFVSWDSAKHSDSTTEGRTLLVHTSVPFGIKHLESEKDKVRDMILEALEDVMPGLPDPSHAHIIRWRYSQVSRPYAGCPGCVVLCRHPLVVATGDGFTGSNFENCLKAAHATVAEISAQIIL